MRKVYSIIQITLTALLVIVIGAFAAGKFIFNLTPYVVMSGSMEPAVKTGSLCFVNEGDRDVNVGDIIAFHGRDGMAVTHRVVDITEDGEYVTKGDNNSNEDAATVREDDVMGTTVLAVPKIGYFIVWMKTPTGIIVILTVAAAFMLAGCLRPRCRKARNGGNAEKKLCND